MRNLEINEAISVSGAGGLAELGEGDLVWDISYVIGKWDMGMCYANGGTQMNSASRGSSGSGGLPVSGSANVNLSASTSTTTTNGNVITTTNTNTTTNCNTSTASVSVGPISFGISNTVCPPPSPAPSK
jgi:hypothetical protein